jgi:hypothetical protein
MMSDYKKEVDLCNDFIFWSKMYGYKVYPECGGWDMLLVKNGVQIGVQAKLKANMKVLAQALDGVCERKLKVSPHYRVVLVASKPSSDFIKLAKACRIIIISFFGNISKHYCLRYNDIKAINYNYEFKSFIGSARYYRYAAKKRVKLPLFVADIKAGVPSPRNVSDWKILCIKAERLCIKQGYITSRDVKTLMSEIEDCNVRNANTVLQYFFTPSIDKCVINGRKLIKYVLNKHIQSPSVQYDYIAECINDD